MSSKIVVSDFQFIEFNFDKLKYVFFTGFFILINKLIIIITEINNFKKYLLK